MAVKDIVKGICNATRCKYDVYTKERADELFTIKDDFAVLTGTILTTDTTKSINYPDGFNQNNCVVVSTGIKKTTMPNWVFDTTYDSLSIANGGYSVRTILYESDIKITAKAITISNNGVAEGDITADADYKIVLMKIS